MFRNYKELTRISARGAALLLLALLAAYCGRKDEEIPVYEATPRRVYEGSLYYAQAGCHSCHGTAWDGSGAEAGQMSKLGFKLPNFKTVSEPTKTPLVYFKAVTMGTRALDKARVNHSWQNYTDRGRWAMANFLYSLAPGFKERDQYGKHLAALAQAEEEIKRAYALAAKNGKRRWELGYKPAQERDPAPELPALIKKAGLQ